MEPTPCIRTTSVKRLMAAPPAPATCTLHPASLHHTPSIRLLAATKQHLPSRNRAAHGNEPDRNCKRRNAPAKGASASGALQWRQHPKHESNERVCPPQPVSTHRRQNRTRSAKKKDTNLHRNPGRQTPSTPPASETCHPDIHPHHRTKQRLCSPACETEATPSMPKQVRHLNCGICLFGIILLNSCRKSFY